MILHDDPKVIVPEYLRGSFTIAKKTLKPVKDYFKEQSSGP